MGNGRADAGAAHGLAKGFPILGSVDGFTIRADHLDAQFFKYSGLRNLERRVEAGLSAKGGQERVRPFLPEHGCQHLGGDRLDIGVIRHLGISHDGGWIRVEQHHLIAFFLERLARLRAGVVELARLADDYGAGADDANLLEIGALGHFYFASSIIAMNRPKRYSASCGPALASG